MDIVKIDEDNKTVVVEPMVTIERLVAALIPKGWVVPIVPEIGKMCMKLSLQRIFLLY